MLKKIAALTIALLLTCAAHAEVWEARYGVAETFGFKLYNADGTLDVDEADGGTEVSLSCNEGAETTATNDFVDEGTTYSIALTAAELQCERVVVVVAATTTEAFFIQTVGHASAMTPTTGWETGDAFARIGAAGAGLTNIDLPNQTMNITGTLSGSVGSVTAVSSGAITEASFATTAGTFAPLGIVDQGTAQSATGTTLVLRSAAAFADDELIGATIVTTGGSAGVGQARTITDYVSSTDTATVATWTTTPTGTITYKVFGTASGSGSDIGTGTGLTAIPWNSSWDAEVESEVDDALGSGTGTALTAVPWNSSWDAEVQSEAADALTVYDPPTAAELTSEVSGLLTSQRIITGTCDSGSTTTCVDSALTQADASQLEDRLICFSDSWCALITTFAPSTDTVTTTKTAPSTRGSVAYTIFPATLE